MPYPAQKSHTKPGYTTVGMRHAKKALRKRWAPRRDWKPLLSSDGRRVFGPSETRSLEAAFAFDRFLAVNGRGMHVGLQLAKMEGHRSFSFTHASRVTLHSIAHAQREQRHSPSA